MIKGGARGGQIGPAAMDHLSVGRELTVTHLNIFAHNHYTMFRLMSETCRHQKDTPLPVYFLLHPTLVYFIDMIPNLLDCKPLWGMYCVFRNWIHVYELFVAEHLIVLQLTSRYSCGHGQSFSLRSERLTFGFQFVSRNRPSCTGA